MINNHIELVDWSKKYKSTQKSCPSIPTVKYLRNLHSDDLDSYFSLCGLARSFSAEKILREQAHAKLFNIRVALEKSIYYTFDSALISLEDKIKCVLSNEFYGMSKKQGVSLRLPLQSCEPTKLCSNACYAHDVLDATPFALIRGAINGWLARCYEESDKEDQQYILQCLTPHSRRAIKKAKTELLNLPEHFQRRAYIRFSHVGEIVDYPNFANALAKQVELESDGKVDCVVYTRHSNAKKLDPDLWVINFTLDNVSIDRKNYAPESARLVSSAFGGLLRDDVSVNFLEHHRHEHVDAIGDGPICPATKPETVDRSCDGCECNKCFVRPMSISLL